MAQTETEVVKGIGSDYEVKYGFHVPEDYFFKSGRGLSHELVDAISSHKDEPDWMRKFRHKLARLLQRPPAPTWGGDVGRSTSRTSTTTSSPPRSRRRHGKTCPLTSRTRGTSSASPRPRRSTSPASAPSTSRGRLPQAQGRPRASGCLVPRHGLRPARARGRRQGVLRQDHPAERQQVRGTELGCLVGRLVHLRAAGREDRDAAPGLLPHQRGEHGPVRAHADHRRRGRYVHYVEGCTAPIYSTTRCTRRSSRSSSRRAAAAATRRSRTGRRTSTTSSRSAPSPTRTRRWSGWTATSARS